MGETAPNAVLYGVAIAGFSHEWGRPPPTRFYVEWLSRTIVKVLEKAKWLAKELL
jgi:hypothetical protein